jgi:C4-dicarboxylate-specific signal transduction histidine kinase
VIAWHRRAFRVFWRRRSLAGRPSIRVEIRRLIRLMAHENATWGAPRIHGELLKLGYVVAERTVSRYLARIRPQPTKPRSQTWTTFLTNHARDIVASTCSSFDLMATLGSQIGQFIERKRAESALQVARTELAHLTRVTTMGELTASIAHEVKQPITAAVTSAQTALRWLEAKPPELGEVREALSRIVRAGKRAGDVIGRIRALVTKAPPRKDSLDINAAIREVVELTRGEAVKNGVSVRTDLAEGLPLIQGDRVQLQQVILNLIINGIEAMTGVEASRELLISSRKDDAEGVLVAVADTGPGLAAGALEQVFAAFYTTKPSGLGLGLSICRSIIEAHDGRLWASANERRGAVFQFTLPAPAR